MMRFETRKIYIFFVTLVVMEYNDIKSIFKTFPKLRNTKVGQLDSKYFFKKNY